MILLQLSSGSGPIECAHAVSLASKLVLKETQALKLGVNTIEQVMLDGSNLPKSILFEVKGHSDEQAMRYAKQWQGSMLWVCQSQFRPRHKRKNWFFEGRIFDIAEQSIDLKIRYETCRSSGAGGQHVNTTDSAVRAVDEKSGISARAESQRSQHANKKLATILLHQKLQALADTQKMSSDKDKWLGHKQLVRGNAKRVFKGLKFTSLT